MNRRDAIKSAIGALAATRLPVHRDDTLGGFLVPREFESELVNCRTNPMHAEPALFLTQEQMDDCIVKIEWSDLA